MTGYISAWLILLGMVALVASIVRTQHLIGILRDKRPWPSLRNLMAFLAIGYGVYLYAIVANIPMNKDLIAGEIFFLAALFMLLVVQYAYQTIHDILHLDELKQLANSDELTGLFSRRAILKRLEDEFQKAGRFGFSMSVAMIDIDHFKAVNDTYTHVAGDEVLREVAKVLQKRLRKFDVLGRVGGDEFLCVLPGTGDVGAMTTAERIRERVTELRFEIVAADNLRVLKNGEETDKETFTTTVSIGVATMHSGIENTTELVRASDVALYAAKDAGRNKVMLADVEDSAC